MIKIEIIKQTANHMPGQIVSVHEGVAKILTKIGKARYVEEDKYVEQEQEKKPKKRRKKQDTDD